MRPADLPRFATIGERVRYWREQRGMSRTRLAQLVGAKGPSTISDLELGNTKRPMALHRYAKALKVTTKYLETDVWEDPAEPEESPSPPDFELPLDVDMERLAQLDPIERDWVSMRLNKLLEEIEAVRPRTRRRHAS